MRSGSRITKVHWLGALLAWAIGSSAAAATASFTGALTVQIGNGFGSFASPSPVTGSATGVLFGARGTSFTVPGNVVVANASSPVGFTANAMPNSICTVLSITNQANPPGSFSGTPSTIIYDDRILSAGTTVPTTGIAPGTTNLSAIGGTITLVTPFLVLIRGATTEKRAGFASLALTIPEPGAFALLGVRGAGFALSGRVRKGQA